MAFSSGDWPEFGYALSELGIILTPIAIVRPHGGFEHIVIIPQNNLSLRYMAHPHILTNNYQLLTADGLQGGSTLKKYPHCGGGILLGR